MLKLQEKIFFRSIVRIIMLFILLGGGLIYHIGIIARQGEIEAIREYGAVDDLTWQVYLFVFYFIIMVTIQDTLFKDEVRMT